MKTVIMAGGKGTRIAELFPDIPKPLIPITNANGVSRPVLEWELLSLAAQGFNDIILTVGYKAQQIQNYFGDGSKLGMDIKYFVETTPLGNAGALVKYRSQLGDEPFLLLIADAMFDVDFNRFVAFHKQCGGLATLFTHPNSHPYDSSLIVTNSKGMVDAWLTKEDPRPQRYKNCVNAGLQVIDPKTLDLFIERTGITPEIVGTTNCQTGRIVKVDMDRQILKPLCGQGVMFAYCSPEYCKDMGTPERFEQVSRDFQNGIVASKNLAHPQKAMFLDRDGTINKYVGFLRSTSEFELCDGVAEAIKKINNNGYLAIVITNQPVIARGEVSVAELDEIHMKLETELGKSGAYIDGIYYCPHHPDKGWPGEVTELKIDCNCRKPKPGMILKATKDYNIDLANSWFIGDSKRDVECGKNAGCKTVLLTNGESGFGQFGQDVTAGGLLEAVDLVISMSRKE